MKTCIASLTLFAFVCGSGVILAADNLKIYNWSECTTPKTVTNFAKETGIQAAYDVYDSNETLDSKLTTDQSGHDVVFPSNHFTAKQTQTGALKKLDESQLPNWKNLNPVPLKASEVNDPGSQYGFPYPWGTTGIDYNPVKIKTVLGDDTPLDSWDIFLKPEYIQKLSKCGVAASDNGLELLLTTLSCLGLPHHSQKADDHKQAQATLLKMRPYIRYFHFSKYASDLANGEVCMVVGFSGDILQAATRAKEANSGVEVHYSMPEEGPSLRFNMVSTPVNAPDEKAGYAFMNYSLRPEMMVAISNHMHCANDNLAADPLVDAEIKAGLVIYLPQEKMAKLFVLESVPQKIDHVCAHTRNTVKTGK